MRAYYTLKALFTGLSHPIPLKNDFQTPRPRIIVKIV